MFLSTTTWIARRSSWRSGRCRFPSAPVTPPDRTSSMLRIAGRSLRTEAPTRCPPGNNATRLVTPRVLSKPDSPNPLRRWVPLGEPRAALCVGRWRLPGLVRHHDLRRSFPRFQLEPSWLSTAVKVNGGAVTFPDDLHGLEFLSGPCAARMMQTGPGGQTIGGANRMVWCGVRAPECAGMAIAYGL